MSRIRRLDRSRSIRNALHQLVQVLNLLATQVAPELVSLSVCRWLAVRNGINCAQHLPLQGRLHGVVPRQVLPTSSLLSKNTSLGRDSLPLLLLLKLMLVALRPKQKRSPLVPKQMLH